MPINDAHTLQDRMWIFRQSVRHLNCSNFPLDLPDGSTLSRLLCTFPNVSQIVDDDGRICVLQGQGGRYTGVEVSEQCMVNSDCVTGATGHLVAPRWVPVDWEVTWSLSVMVQFKNSNRKLHKKLEHACQNRQGVWGHRIQTLSVNGLPRTAFTALFRALLQGPKSAPDTLAIFIDGYSYQDVQALGSITSGHVRTEGIIAPRDPDSTMVPELLDELDCSTFSGVEQFILVMGEQSFGHISSLATSPSKFHSASRQPARITASLCPRPRDETSLHPFQACTLPAGDRRTGMPVRDSSRTPPTRRREAKPLLRRPHHFCPSGDGTFYRGASSPCRSGVVEIGMTTRVAKLPGMASSAGTGCERCRG
jgi:hypothetical protein